MSGTSADGVDAALVEWPEGETMAFSLMGRNALLGIPIICHVAPAAADPTVLREIALGNSSNPCC